jgi:hypothetical protein
VANVQPQFELFDKAIRLGRFEENATLREKRDIIRKKLREQLPEVFKNHGEECPAYYFRDQGSYEMDTGTKPLDCDYDIDQGVYFSVSTADYPNPVVLKERVHEALDGHTNRVEIRRSCVTVFYSENDEPIYHVDLAIYSDGEKNDDGKSRLAKGKLNSSPENRFWEVSDPEGLIEKIEAKFEGNDRAQFRRAVRYQKRWKSVNFTSDGNAAPLGIGLTVATYDDLQPTYSDPLAGTPDDLTAMRSLVSRILNRFSLVWDENEQQWVRRLVVELPVEPWNDLFAKMTNAQMEDFEAKLKTLKAALDGAAESADPTDACEQLRSVFGDDFPVPPREETAKKHAPAIVSSSNSA